MKGFLEIWSPFGGRTKSLDTQQCTIQMYCQYRYCTDSSKYRSVSWFSESRCTSTDQYGLGGTLYIPYAIQRPALWRRPIKLATTKAMNPFPSSSSNSSKFSAFLSQPAREASKERRIDKGGGVQFKNSKRNGKVETSTIPNLYLKWPRHILSRYVQAHTGHGNSTDTISSLNNL